MVNGGLGHTDIVKHQISTGDEPAVKQIVRRYLATKIEDVQYFMEALGIIQESIPTMLIKKKYRGTRLCIQ